MNSKSARVWRFAKDPVHRVQRYCFLRYQKNRRGRLVVRDRVAMTTWVQRL